MITAVVEEHDGEISVLQYSTLESLAHDMAHRYLEGLKSPLRAAGLIERDFIAVVARATEIALRAAPA